jgi:hypothetical protein
MGMEINEITWDDVKVGMKVRESQGTWVVVEARRIRKGKLQVKFVGYGSWLPVASDWPVMAQV